MYNEADAIPMSIQSKSIDDRMVLYVLKEKGRYERRYRRSLSFASQAIPPSKGRIRKGRSTYGEMAYAWISLRGYPIPELGRWAYHDHRAS